VPLWCLSATAATGLVKFNISPWGTVVVDGITRGISNATQLRQLELSVGRTPSKLPSLMNHLHQQTIEVVAERTNHDHAHIQVDQVKQTGIANMNTPSTSVLKTASSSLAGRNATGRV
jgi:hypothetical protein